MSLPTSITQFLSVAVPVVVSVTLFTLLAACLVMTGKWPHIVAPLKPESRVGQARGFCSWLSAVRGLTEADVFAAGGLDAVLSYRRVKMRAEISFWWCLVGVPVAVVYALNIAGGSTQVGFDRITFQNANVVRKNDGTVRNGDSLARMWITVFAAYVMPVIAYVIVEKYDEQATQDMLREASKAPWEHYGVVLTRIDPKSRTIDALTHFFDAALGEGAVRRVVLIENLSKAPPGIDDDDDDDDDEEEKKSKSSALARAASLVPLGGPGGVRQRVAAFFAALKSARRADLAAAKAAEAEQTAKKSAVAPPKLPGQKTPEEARVAARKELEKKRRAVVRASQQASEVGAAAIVLFDSVAKATSASCAPLGIANTWGVAPMPEPRDVLWDVLEAVESDETVIDTKVQTGSRLKTSIYVLWSLILGGISWVALFLLKVADRQLTGAAKQIVAIASGLVPALVASIMMGLVVTIMRNINLKTRGSLECWRESALQNTTQTDFVTFLIAIGFAVPLLGASLLDAALNFSGNPLQIFKLIANNVPGKAYYFAMIILVKVAGMLNYSTRFVPYVVYRILSSSFFCKTDFERSQVGLPTPHVFANSAGWETFAFVVGAVYCPLAPYGTGFAFLYLWLFAGCVKLDHACLTKTPFTSNGLLWRQSVAQTYTAAKVSGAISVGVLLFSGAFIHFICLLPLFLVYAFIGQKSAKRFERKSIHGKARGRLALYEASAVDAKRGPTFVETVVEPAIDADLLCAAPVALPVDDARRAILPGLDKLPEDDGIEDRQRAILAWFKRYDKPSSELGIVAEEVDPKPSKPGMANLELEAKDMA